MPIIFTDNHTCEKCGRVFEWNYFKQIRQKNIDSPQFKVETRPHEKTLAHSCRQRNNGIYDIKVNCPYCYYDNYFTFIVK